MVKKSNRRGNSLVTNAPPTGRTTGASGGFDIVDGVAVPEDRSVRRFDGAELSSRFSTSIGGFDTLAGGETYTGDASITAPNSLQGAYNAISGLYGGDTSTGSVNQAVAGSLEERGAILEEDYPFANQAMGTTEVTQDTVNEILAGAIAARQEIMGGTAFPTKEQELAVQAAVADLFTAAGIGVDQSTINPYSLEGDSLGRFVDRITVVDEIVKSSSSADAASSAADSSADAAAAAKAKADAAADSADSSAASSDSSAAADAAAAADATGGESITLEDLVAYLLDIPTESNAASSDIDGGFGEGDGTETLIAQLEEVIATETDPLLKAKLELELAKYKNQPTETLEAEVARLEAEAESFISGNPTQIGGNTVFTTDTSGLSNDAENVTLTPGQDITIVDTGNGTPAVDGDTKILTKEEKDAAFNEVLAGVNENTVIADIISAAVEIYGDTADAVVAVANAANDANVSAEDLANATNTSIEAVNQAAATANTTISNQTTAESRAADKAAADAAAAKAKADADAAAAKAKADAIAAAVTEAACTLAGGVFIAGICLDTEAAADAQAAADAAAAAKAACDAAGGNIVNGECVCPTGYSKVDGKCVADGGDDDDDDDDDDDGACPPGSGKEKNLAGDCVCPTGYTEDDDGVCQADGGDDDDDDDGDGDGACPPGSGKEKNLAGDCVCPDGKVEDANGVCQDAGDGDGACPPGSGKEKNLAGDCVCPDGKVEDANGVCQDAGGGGGCTGGKIDDGAGGCKCPGLKIDDGAGGCKCPTGYTEDANGVCQGTGTGNCTGGRTRDLITKECVCPSDKPNFNETTQQCEGAGDGDPEPEIAQAVPDLFNVVRTKPGEKVGELDFYDIGGTSIFQSGAKTEEEEDPLAFLYSEYAEGGIVQDYGIEELIRFLNK
jgi:hypothetical protein